MSLAIQVNPAEYGLDVKRASEIEAAFKPMLEKMTALESEFNRVAALPVDAEACKQAKKLRLEYVRVRTGTAAIHKELKAFYLAGGRFVDGWKNAQQFAAQGIEEKLESIETHFERIEAARIEAVAVARRTELAELGATVMPECIGQMDDAVWGAYITGVRVAREAQIKAEREAEAARQAKIKAEREEQERIRAENAKLRAEREESECKQRVEAAERERVAKAEREKIEAEKRAAAEVARKEREALEAKLRAERENLKRVQDAEAARKREEERVAAEQRAKEAAADAKRKNTEHRAKIHREIGDAISDAIEAGHDIAEEIAAGKIPHLHIKY